MTLPALSHRFAAALVGLMLCSAVAAHDYRAGAIEVLHPWLRLPPPVSQTAAAYLVVRNHGADADRLLEVRADFARRAEMHASSLKDGVMRMERRDAVELPAAGEARFEPGGLHIMLIGLETSLAEGSIASMTLRFERAGELQVPFTVQRGDTATHDGH